MPSVNLQPRKSKPAFPEDFGLRVKTELLRRDTSVAQLARSLGRSRTAVSQAVNHPTRFPGIKKLIERALKMTA